MQAAANVGKFSGLFEPPSGAANYHYMDRFVMNAMLSELPGIAVAIVTAFYLASTFISLM